MQQDTFADLKSKAKIEELAWISPSVAVSYCGIQKFEIGNASEGLEWAIVPMQLTSDKQLNCIFELATQPSKYDLRFEISASKN